MCQKCNTLNNTNIFKQPFPVKFVANHEYLALHF